LLYDSRIFKTQHKVQAKKGDVTLSLTLSTPPRVLVRAEPFPFSPTQAKIKRGTKKLAQLENRKTTAEKVRFSTFLRDRSAMGKNGRQFRFLGLGFFEVRHCPRKGVQKVMLQIRPTYYLKNNTPSPYSSHF
jgi:hypothetical protein